MTDVLKQLQVASWRDIEFPIALREYGFAHEQSKHRFIFNRDQLVEPLGRENPTWRYTIPFREDIARGPYENLYSRVYPRFLEACEDDSDGILVDPVHGTRPAKCISLKEIVDPDRRDGIDVEVDFIFSPDEAFDLSGLGENITSVEGARGLAGLLDRDIERIDWQQEPTPETTVSIFDAISSVANQLEVAANKPVALLEDAAFRIDKMIESIDRVANPTNEAARQRARRLKLATLVLRKQIARPPQRSRLHLVQTDIGLIALSGRLGMSVDDMLRVNPQLQGKTIVPAGTQVVFFVR